MIGTEEIIRMSKRKIRDISHRSHQFIINHMLVINRRTNKRVMKKRQIKLMALVQLLKGLPLERGFKIPLDNLNSSTSHEHNKMMVMGPRSLPRKHFLKTLNKDRFPTR